MLFLTKKSKEVGAKLLNLLFRKAVPQYLFEILRFRIFGTVVGDIGPR